jgi:hypothetical protein
MRSGGLTRQAFSGGAMLGASSGGVRRQAFLAPEAKGVNLEGWSGTRGLGLRPPPVQKNVGALF